MPPAFPGFPKEGPRFLKDLDSHNNREWFLEHKSIYEKSLKRPMMDLVDAVNQELAQFAPDYQAEPMKAIGRINRDTRFSKDKAPYKTEISAVFPCRGREKHECAGFFFAVGADYVDVCLGLYMPGPEQLGTVRRTLARDHAAFGKLAGSAALIKAMGVMQGERLKRVPKDFDADHPAGDLLRCKQFYFRTMLPGDIITTPKLLPEIIRRFRVATPFVEFLDAALGA